MRPKRYGSCMTINFISLVLIFGVEIPSIVGVLMDFVWYLVTGESMHMVIPFAMLIASMTLCLLIFGTIRTFRPTRGYYE